jgi:tRNA modification GTPase
VIGDIERLVETQHRHRCLQEGLRVVIVGAPNAGKSSLLNALLGEERAIVSEEAGTTRDFISETLRLEPFALRLTDTAGLREGKNLIEQSGIAKTLQQMRSADCLLLVLDASAEMPEFSGEITELLDSKKTFVVCNKIDLVKDEKLTTPKNFKSFFGEGPGEPIFAKNGSPGVLNLPPPPFSLVSAKTGAGLDALKASLRQFLVERYWVVEGDSDVMVNVRHAGHLERAKGFLVEALEGMVEKNRPIELVASDLRGALNEIDCITGTVGTEAILDRIFQQFCIGK